MSWELPPEQCFYALLPRQYLYRTEVSNVNYFVRPAKLIIVKQTLDNLEEDYFRRYPQEVDAYLSEIFDEFQFSEQAHPLCWPAQNHSWEGWVRNNQIP